MGLHELADETSYTHAVLPITFPRTCCFIAMAYFGNITIREGGLLSRIKGGISKDAILRWDIAFSGRV